MKDLILREFSRDVSVMVLPPHVFRRSQRRSVYKEIYRSIKQGNIVVGVCGLLAMDCRKFAMDMVKCQLVKFGYKRLFLFCLYPFSQLVGGTIYLYGTAPKVIVIGKTIVQLGNQFMKAGGHASNLGFLVLDVVLFGEPVSILDNVDFSILGPDKND